MLYISCHTAMFQSFLMLNSVEHTYVMTSQMIPRDTPSNAKASVWSQLGKNAKNIFTLTFNQLIGRVYTPK